MNQPLIKSDKNNHRAEKARMLITILGNDFTRNSKHPFFRSLTETASNPDVSQAKSPDISRALRNLMSHLSSRDHAFGVSADVPKKRELSSQENSISPSQHPALIASTLAKMDSPKRRVALRSLSGPLACRVLVYLREIEDREA